MKDYDENDDRIYLDGFDPDNEKVSKSIDNLAKALLAYWERENDGVNIRHARASILELMGNEIADFVSSLEISS
jgi:hypothetical protein